MRCRFSEVKLFLLGLAILATPLIGGCAHDLALEMEPARVANKLGFAGCNVSEPLRRYQALDFADSIGNRDLASSPEWAKAISMMQPGDEIRRVFCKKNGDNFFGLFRDNSLLFTFGGMIYN